LLVRTSLTCISAALVLISMGRAVAAVFGRNRMPLLTPGFEARLKPETRANLKRTLSLGGGTAFLVSVRGDKGLLLTNEHVIRGKEPQIEARCFSGEHAIASAPTGRVLGQSRKLDYALVEVDLAGLPQALVGTPAKLRHGPLLVGEQTYKVGFPGLPRLETPEYGDFDWTANDRKQGFGKQPKRTVIAAGREVGGGKVRLFYDPDPRPDHRSKVPRYSVALDDSSLPGNSGSPVFSAVTHEVVALHWAGGTSRPSSDPELRSADRWNSANYAVPISKVLTNLRGRLRRGELPTDVQEDVRALVGEK